MTLLEIFTLLEFTAVGSAIRDSTWLFPAIEAVHLLGLAMLGGAVLVVDLRLLGVGLRSLGPAELARDAMPWLLGAIACMFVTGIPLFLSEAVKCYYNTSFWVKMTTLVVALVFCFTVRPRILALRLEDWRHKVCGLVSIGLWLTVAAAGRWIGFS